MEKDIKQFTIQSLEDNLTIILQFSISDSEKQMKIRESIDENNVDSQIYDFENSECTFDFNGNIQGTVSCIDAQGGTGNINNGKNWLTFDLRYGSRRPHPNHLLGAYSLDLPGTIFFPSEDVVQVNQPIEIAIVDAPIETPPETGAPSGTGTPSGNEGPSGPEPASSNDLPSETPPAKSAKSKPSNKQSSNTVSKDKKPVAKKKKVTSKKSKSKSTAKKK